MSDRTIQSALLSLLQLGLWEKEESNIIPSLSKDQWVNLYQRAQEHTIEGIIFDGIQKLPPNLLPPRDLLLKWAVKIDQIERHNSQMNTSIKEQVKLFNQEEIYPILLKGQGVAVCYPIPNHRVCGDIDWYFNSKKDYQKANNSIKKKGIKLNYSAGFSSEYSWNKIVTEHHQRMFDLHNPFCFSFLNRLKKQYYNQNIHKNIEDSTFLLPAPILTIVQVNIHILKHLLSFGLGIRQLCDSARLYHSYQTEINGQELKQIYKKLGILSWIHLLHAVLVKSIGLAPQSLPFELPEKINADWMMDEIWNSGNFGFFDSRFKTDSHEAHTARKQAKSRVGSNLIRYFKFVPMEAISFPLIQLYSRFTRK